MNNSGTIEDEKLRKWARFGVIENAQISISGKIYDEPDNQYFSNYLSWIEKNISNEVPEYLVPLNPPPAPHLQKNVTAEDFTQSFNKVTDYILYAAEACQRLRVDEEINRRSRLRWFSVLADIYDEYKNFVAKVPSLKGNAKVIRASEIAKVVKKDKLKRTALAKEVMAGRRINRILIELKGQWHIIDLLDFITKDLLVNNSQEFIDKLVQGIRWPMIDIEDFPYKTLSSGSKHQYYLPNSEAQVHSLDE